MKGICKKRGNYVTVPNPNRMRKVQSSIPEDMGPIRDRIYICIEGRDHMQNEITRPIPLLDEKGHITEPGWARQLYWDYERAAIRGPKWRIKEWDYYLVANSSFGVAFTISDLGYLGMASVSFLNFSEGWEHTETFLTPFPMGKYGLSSHSDNGNAKFQNKKLQLKYSVSPGRRRIYCHFSDFYKNQDLDVELSLTQPPMDTMCIATPWKKRPACFYYNQKINCLPANGKAVLGRDTYYFKEDRDFGVLDWGRGVWTYNNTWYWGTGSGLVNGIPFGLNLGYGFSDRSSATENVIFYDNKIHKLNQVEFVIPKTPNGSYDFLKTWKITSDDNRLSGVFTPILNRQAHTNALIIATIQNQIFGHFNGTAVLDDGTSLNVKDFFCAVEVVHNRY